MSGAQPLRLRMSDVEIEARESGDLVIYDSKGRLLVEVFHDALATERDAEWMTQLPIDPCDLCDVWVEASAGEEE